MANSWVRKLTSNVHIFGRLGSRLDLRSQPDVNYPVILMPTVQPITNIDELVQSFQILQGTGIDGGSTGYKVALTVPSGKRYHVKTYEFLRTGATGALIGSLMINNGSITHNIHAIAAPTANAADVFTQEIVLEAGWTIGLYVSTLGAGDTFTFNSLVVVEDAY